MRPRHVGMPIRRTEDPRLADRQWRVYRGSQAGPALHVAFRRSEQPHARIVRIDTARRKTAPGVVAVFTADGHRRRFQAGDPVFADGQLLRHADPAAGSGKVRYVGEAIAAVVAKSRYLAEDALELIEIEFEPLGAVPIQRAGIAEALRCCTKRPAPTF